MAAKITLHEMTPEELRKLLKELVRDEFDYIFKELQKSFGEDDLIPTGTASRLLGVCDKYMKILRDDGHFSVYHHLKERRYNRGEILEYREKYKINKKRG